MLRVGLIFFVSLTIYSETFPNLPPYLEESMSYEYVFLNE